MKKKKISTIIVALFILLSFSGSAEAAIVRRTSAALLVEVKNFDGISSAKAKIEKINPNIQINSVYQNIEAMVQNMRNLKMGINTFSFILISILFILMMIVFFFRTEKKKYEIAILKANGLTKEETQLTVWFEGVFLIVKIAFISFLLYICLNYIISMFLNLNIYYSDYPKTALFIIIVSALSVMPPIIISIIRLSKYDPSTLMRN